MKANVILKTSIAVMLISQCSAVGAPLNEGYIGSEKCISCHLHLDPEIVNGWRTGTHHTTMKSVSGNEDILEIFGMNASLETKDVLAVIGHKNGGYAFVGTDFQVYPSEGLLVSESEPPYEPPHNEIGIKGKELDASQRCLGCHATGFSVSEKTFVEPGVGCEACHGPGKKHVDTRGSADTIVKPSDLPPDRSRMVCGQCHSLGKDPSGKHPFPVMRDGGTLKPYQPGQDMALGFVDDKPVIARKGGEYSLLVQSPEYYAKQVCMDCHDPHGRNENPSMLIHGTSETCLRCHRISFPDLSTHWGADKSPCWECHDYAHTH